MIKYIIDIYRDWLQFRMIRKQMNVLDPVSHEKILSYVVNRYDEEKENELNGVLNYSLMKEMVQNNITPEFYRGFLFAIQLRLSLIRNNKKFITKK